MELLSTEHPVLIRAFLLLLPLEQRIKSLMLGLRGQNCFNVKTDKTRCRTVFQIDNLQGEIQQDAHI